MTNQINKSPLTSQKTDKPAPFVISVSSRALFDLEAEHRVFVEQGEEAFEKWQITHKDEMLRPGPAFEMIRKLLDINTRLPEGARPFNVVLMSRNSSETGLRVIKALDHYKLHIETMVCSSGTSVSKYLVAAGVDLMLSSNPEEVRKAIDRGMGAAEIIPHALSENSDHEHDDKIRLAFDGDAVLFSDEAEKVYAEHGLLGFRNHEVEHAGKPLPKGPIAGLLEVIHAVQQHFPNKSECPFRTLLITARGAQAMERPINTLSGWDIRVDETIACGGAEKGPYIKAFGADLFFDDSRRNIESSISHQVPGAHVPYGVRNVAGGDESNYTGGNAPVSKPVSAPVNEANTGLETALPIQETGAPKPRTRKPR